MSNESDVRRWKRSPAYKLSGVEWLEKVPVHWTVKPLKRSCGINQDVLSEETPDDYELAYVDIGNVDSLGNILSEQTLRFENAPSRARRRVRRGDTIISTVRTYLRAISFMESPPENRIVSTGFAVLRPSPEVEPKFLWRAVQSSEFVDAVVSHSEGIGYPAINPSQLGSLSICLPSLDEQRRIVAFLDHETAKLDSVIGGVQLLNKGQTLGKMGLLIERLQEYRSALISAAVTGKIDVREETKP